MKTNLAEITELAQPTLDRISTLAHEASDKALVVKDQAAEWLSERGTELSNVPVRLRDNTASYVSANPFKALGIAIVAALVVGRLMK